MRSSASFTICASPARRSEAMRSRLRPSCPSSSARSATSVGGGHTRRPMRRACAASASTGRDTLPAATIARSAATRSPAPPMASSVHRAWWYARSATASGRLTAIRKPLSGTTCNVPKRGVPPSSKSPAAAKDGPPATSPSALPRPRSFQIASPRASAPGASVSWCRLATTRSPSSTTSTCVSRSYASLRSAASMRSCSTGPSQSGAVT